MQNTSEPRPLLHGSTSIIIAAVGDRRVDGVAALLHHPEPGLRGERMRGRDDVAGEDGTSGRRIGASDQSKSMVCQTMIPARPLAALSAGRRPDQSASCERDFALLLIVGSDDDDDQQRRRR